MPDPTSPNPTLQQLGAPSPNSAAPVAQNQPQGTPAQAPVINPPSGNVTIPGSGYTPPAKPTRDALLGKLARTMLGQDMTYSVDPKTGQTVATPVKQTPGSLWKHMVTGALLGMAAGSQAKDFGGGVAKGAGATIEANQQADLRRQAAARADFEQQQKIQEAQRQQQTLDLDAKRTNAQVEMYNHQRIIDDANLNLHAADTINTMNESATGLKKWIVEQGGQLAPVSGNGAPNGSVALSQLYSKHPEQFTPGDGYTRINVTTTDLNGLHDDPEKGWVDAQGNPVNLSDHSTTEIYYVPVSTLKQPMTHTGAEWEKMAPSSFPKGSLNPDRNYTLTGQEALGIFQKQSEFANQDRLENIRIKHDSDMAAIDVAKQNIAALNDQLRQEQTNNEDTTQTKKDLETQRKILNDTIAGMNPEFRKAYQAANPTDKDGNPIVNLPKPAQAGTPIPDDVLKSYLDANGGDVEKAKAAATAAGWGTPKVATAPSISDEAIKGNQALAQGVGPNAFAP